MFSALSAGMSLRRTRFRWASCQLDTLAKCLTRNLLRKALRDLPPDLDSTYRRILDSIDGNYTIIARRILSWLAFSVRVLRLSEVAEIVALDADADIAYDHGAKLEDPEDALRICQSLVITSPMDRLNDKYPAESKADCLVLLAHYSVKEYLVSERIKHGSTSLYALRPLDVNRQLTEACLAYILQMHQHKYVADATLQSSQVASYAAEFWVRHFHRAETSDRTVNLVMRLLTSGDGAYTHWLRVYKGAQISSPAGMVEILPTPLHTAAIIGITGAVRLLISDLDVEVNGVREELGKALLSAAALGHDEIVEVLLENGADVNVCGGFYGRALFAAGEEGHDTTVELLLQYGADISAQGGRYGNLLNTLAFQGRSDLLQTVWPRLSSPRTHCDAQGRTSLHLAARSGRTDTMAILLELGADINAKDKRNKNVLSYAASSGDVSAVRFVLEDPNFSADHDDLDDWSCLHWAAKTGAIDVQFLLIEAGYEERLIKTMHPEGYWAVSTIAAFHANDGLVESLRAFDATSESSEAAGRGTEHNGLCDGCEHVSQSLRKHGFLESD